MDPGSAQQRFTLQRVRDKRARQTQLRQPPCRIMLHDSFVAQATNLCEPFQTRMTAGGTAASDRRKLCSAERVPPANVGACLEMTGLSARCVARQVPVLPVTAPRFSCR